VVLPEREKMKTQMEALIYHFKIVTEGIAVPEGEVFQVVESPRGELGYYVVSDGSGNRSGCTCVRPASAICRGCRMSFEKRQISDSIAIMGSLDFVLGDCDR
jgi:NADH-quinone oxidoreductase subunit D